MQRAGFVYAKSNSRLRYPCSSEIFESNINKLQSKKIISATCGSMVWGTGQNYENKMQNVLKVTKSKEN